MKLNRSNLITLAIALIAGIVIGGVVFSGGGSESTNENIAHDHSDESGVWTCSMHPQVRQSEPGSCPFCGMDLIPLSTETDSDPRALAMTDEAVALANIQTTIVQSGSPESALELNGRIKVDERNVHAQTTHFGGRIEELYKNFEGEVVRKGDVIAAIYSPELVAAQEEFLEAKRVASSNPTLYEAAKKKLKFWKINDEQIARIESQNSPIQEIELIAEYNGIVTKKYVNNGDHLKEGQPLLEISDLGALWVVFEVYEKDIDLLSLNQQVSFYKNGSNEELKGTISFISPEVTDTRRVIEVRADVNNNSGRLKPDMFVKGVIRKTAQEGITVPRSAVLWTGKRSIVYIKNSNDWTFELREIELGPRLGDNYQVIAGLQAGEEVVTNGAFTIDAESQLQGKTSMIMPVNHEEVSIEPVGFSEITLSPYQNYQGETDPKFQEQLLELTLAYLPLKDAMVQGEHESIKKSIPLVRNKLSGMDMSLVKGDAHLHWMEMARTMDSSLEQIESLNDRDKQRLEFINLSNALINSLRSFGTNYESPLYIQFCPMANQDQGANWISTEENIINPYFGDMMLTCGSVEEIINSIN